MARPKITVVGSCMMDVIVRVPRLPVRGESLIGRSVAMAVGGKGNNQAIAAARLGADVALIGRVGADAFGEDIAAYAKSAGVDCRWLVVDSDLGTGVAVPIVTDDGANAIVAVPQANLALTPEDVARAAERIAASDLVLLQFEVAMTASRAALRIARRAGVPVIVNAAPVAEHPPELVEGATILVANEVEAEALAPGSASHAERAEQIARKGPATVVVTLGEGGLVAFRGGGALAQHAFVVSAVDSVGAGDAFCAGLGVALAEGADLEDALQFGQAAGALAATRAGAAPALPGRGEVVAFLGGR